MHSRPYIKYSASIKVDKPPQYFRKLEWSWIILSESASWPILNASHGIEYARFVRITQTQIYVYNITQDARSAIRSSLFYLCSVGLLAFATAMSFAITFWLSCELARDWQRPYVSWATRTPGYRVLNIALTYTVCSGESLVSDQDVVVVVEDRSVTPERPRVVDLLHRSAGGVLFLSLRSWSIHRWLGRPVWRFQLWSGRWPRVRSTWYRTTTVKIPYR